MRLQWRREWTAPALVGAVSFSAGVGIITGIGIFLNERQKKNREETRVEPRDDSKLNEAVEEFRAALVALDHRIVEQDYKIAHTFDQIKATLKSLKGEPQRSFDDYAAEMHKNVSAPDGWDHEREIDRRSEDKPYIIRRSEYEDEENGFSQHSTLMYYKGDDVLCDEDDTPIYNKDNVVGVLDFGHGSGDPSIVYIRNHTLKCEYEVILDEGYYLSKVLGQEMEDDLNDDLKHSQLRKFRRSD